MAKERGLFIIMNYIGVGNPDVAKERVKIRVSKGGQGIREDTIEKRYLYIQYFYMKKC